MERSSLTRFAWLSMAAALATIGLKSAAYFLTGSVGLLSDALESLVNLAGAIMAIAMLTIAARPEDEEHAFGHSKAEYFSSGVEGTLILVAALSIALTAVQRLLSPQALEQIGVGLVVSAVASLVNLGTALVLNRAARQYGSITLKANASHLMTDVWTSGGVLLGVGAVALTGWAPLDSLVAIAVAGNIVWSGIGIVRSSIAGLMDTVLPEEEQLVVKNVIEKQLQGSVQYHALRTRQAGARRFVSLHVLVPGEWTVQQGHQLLEQIEAALMGALPNISVFTHLESLDDPTSWQDTALDRQSQSSKGTLDQV